MLVLSRKEGEKIVINDNITITIVALQGHKVRVGIDAPREVPVHREEIQRLRDDELKQHFPIKFLDQGFADQSPEHQ